MRKTGPPVGSGHRATQARVRLLRSRSAEQGGHRESTHARPGLLTGSLLLAIFASAASALSGGATDIVSGSHRRVGAGSAARRNRPAISDSGRFVAFESRAALDPIVAESNGIQNIYVRDRQSPGHTVLITEVFRPP